MAAGAAVLALGTAGVAYAQVPAPSISGTASVSPTKAGTKSKPKNEKFSLSVKNDPGSQTTAKTIKITFPSTLKLSTKGLPQCTKSDEDIVNETPQKACKASIAGKGTANAVVGPTSASPAPVHFVVTPLVGKNQLLFHLAATGGITNKYVVHGKISGKTLTITIGPDVQQPVPGVYSALVDLSSTLSMKKGNNMLISSTGCTGGKHKVPTTVAYAPNPGPPSGPSASTTLEAKCSK
jgi:hypothetical protein